MVVQTSSKDVQIRQLLLHEYRATHKPDQALKNVKSKIGQCELTLEAVKFWFKRFDKGDTSFLKKKNNALDAPQLISNEEYLQNDSYKFRTSVDPLLNNHMITTDGRVCFVIAFKKFRHPKILAIDSFHGAAKEVYKAGCLIGIEDSPRKYFGLIDNERILIYNHSKRQLYLLKFDADALKFEVASQVPIADFDSKYNALLLDDTDKRKFVIFDVNCCVVLGSVDNGIIVINRRFASLNPLYICTKLIGNKLCGFFNFENRNLWLEFDVNEVVDRSIFDFSLEFNTGKSFPLANSTMCDRFLHSNCLYVAFEYQVKLTRVFAFNVGTKVWSDTKIVVMGKSTGMYVDENAILTIKACEDEVSGSNSFYRFPLKKPESLMNLTWLTIMRRSSVFGSKLFRKFSSRLPYICELRSLLSDE